MYYAYPAEKFQFHKGTIKTAEAAGYYEGGFTFQFHKGTIKTSSSFLAECKRENFNSIKVRLKRR